MLGSKSCWRHFFINSLESAGYIGTRLTCLLFLGVIQHVAFYLKGPATSSSSSLLPSPSPHSQTPLRTPASLVFPPSFPLLRPPLLDPKSQESEVEGYSKLLKAAAIPVNCICLISGSICSNFTADVSRNAESKLISLAELSGFHSSALTQVPH